jgi:D-glycerate 3-kinase
MNRDEFGALLGRWLEDAIRDSSTADTPVIIGLSAPQGAGKTTLTRELCVRVAKDGCRMVSISIDDFYLSRAEQIALAKRYSDNPFLQQRGYPGTHDISLGVSVLTALKTLRAGSCLKLPVYDRSALEGLGDRLPKSDWRRVDGPLDLVVVEGWMLGFTPIEDELLSDPSLRVINDLLRSYAAWHSLLDGFIWLEPEDHLFVRQWRVEAEERSVAAGNSGMTAEKIKAFVEMFLPAYETYIPGLRARPPTKAPQLRVVIGRDRLPKEILESWSARLATTK